MTFLLGQLRRPSTASALISLYTIAHNVPLSKNAHPNSSRCLTACQGPLLSLLPFPHRNQFTRHSCTHDSSNPHHQLLLHSFCAKEHLHKALQALSHIHTPLSIPSYLSLLKACIQTKSISLITEIHAHLVRCKVPITGFLGDFLVMALAKCGAVDDAHCLSSTLPHLTVFSWSAIILAYADADRGEEALEAYERMLKEGIEPDSFTFVSLFKACGSIPDIASGKELHAHAQRMGFATHTFVGNTIVSMYGKCGELREAEDAFAALSHRDTVSWNGMLSAYVDQGQGERGLLLYRQMHAEDVIPDVGTFVMAFQSCVTISEEEDGSSVRGISRKQAFYEIGQAMHADARTKNLATHLLVGTAILSMYAKYGTFLEAESVFAMLLHLDTVAWNAMLSVYVEQEQGKKALSLYTHMLKQGASPDHMTYLIILQACGILGENEEERVNNANCLEIGQTLHSEIRSKGYTIHAPIMNTLLNMYGKCGAIAEAEEVFRGMSECDVISWNAMLSAYCVQGQAEKVLSLYRVMQEEQVSLNDITLLCVLQASGEAGALEICRSGNFGLVFADLDKVLTLMATLINAYGRCGSIADAKVIFASFAEPNVVLWNACMAGHAGDESYVGSLCMFEKLKLTSLKPDKVTYTSVLSVCSHSGLVVEGLEYMSSNIGIIREGTHFNILVDLLGRAGDLKRLECLIEGSRMQADLTIWLSVLGACSAHGNLELAKLAFDRAVHMEPKEASVYVLMSNIYADAGLPNWLDLEL